MSQASDRTLIFLRFPPEADGPHGGCHRSYQVWWDCVQARGADRCDVIPYAPRHPWTARRRWSIRSLMLRQNPFSAFFASEVAWETARSVQFSEVLTQYDDYLRRHGPPALCVVEDTVWFHGIVRKNERLGVPTWICPQNLESLDFDGTLLVRDRLHLLSRLGDLANELRTLSACAARFAISRVEAGFLNGIGLETEFYPYRPVGEIRDFFLKIRAARERGSIERGLMVMLGSATHAPTRDGMQWLLEQARTLGLPSGTRVEIVGLGTDSLRGLESLGGRAIARGWVDSPSLADLLSRAHAVLIPHFSGFGALTRLAELPLAGVPVLAASHTTHAVDQLEGVEAYPRHWRCWSSAIERLLGRSGCISPQPAPHGGTGILRQALAAEFGELGEGVDVP